MISAGKGKIILAIEAAVGGGSVSILRDSEVLGSRVGESGVSRAEELLPIIDELIKETVGDKAKLDLIAVSIGPGSFTGLRIGIATAMGLRAALAIPCVGVSLMQALASVVKSSQKIITAVPIGRADICYQMFEKTVDNLLPLGDPSAVDSERFQMLIKENHGFEIVVHSSLSAALNDRQKVRDAGTNLAAIIGIQSVRMPESRLLAPIYVQSPRFA